MHQLFIDSKKDYDSVMREVLFDILIGFSIHMKLVWLIKLCLNENNSRVQVGKHFSDMFPNRNGLKQGYASSPQIFNFALLYTIRGFR